MSETFQIKIIAKSPPNREAAFFVLLSLGIWDYMLPIEREAFVERGEVWDTAAGRALLDVIQYYQPTAQPPLAAAEGGAR